MVIKFGFIGNLILYILIFLPFVNKNSDNKKNYLILKDSVFLLKTKIDSLNKINLFLINSDIKKIKMTYYHPTSAQTDKDSLITASGDTINYSDLELGTLKWVAISRDLKELLKYGDTIFLKNNHIQGFYIIKDLMADSVKVLNKNNSTSFVKKAIRNTIDVLLPIGKKLKLNNCQVFYKK